MKKILIFLTITVLLAACSSDSDPAVTNDGRRVPLQVTGYIADTPLGITRAAGSAWDAADQIGLYAVQSNTTTPIEGGSNVGYVLTGSPGPTNGIDYKVFTSISTSISMPSEGNIDVYGYYPYNAETTDPTALAVNLNIQTEQKSVDLMTTDKEDHTIHGDNTSPSINKVTPSCQLLFHHRLTKLVFNLKAGEDFSSSDIEGATSLTIGSQKTTATYNIYTDELTCVGESNQTITAAVGSTKSGYEKTFEAIVLPNDADNNPAIDCKVTIVVDGRSYSFTIIRTGEESNIKVKTVSFFAGYKYEYNVTVYPFTITVDPDKYTEQW